MPTACLTACVATNPKFVSVASVDGGNKTQQDAIYSAFLDKGIRCYMEGSVRYAVMAPKSRLLEARRVLLSDPMLRTNLIILEEQGLFHFPPKGNVNKGQEDCNTGF